MLPFRSGSVLILLSLNVLLFSCGVPHGDPGSRGGSVDDSASQAKDGAEQKSGPSWYIGRPFRHDSLGRVLFPVVRPEGRKRRSWGYSSESDEGEELHYRHHSGLARRGHFLNLLSWDPGMENFGMLKDSLLHMTRFRFYPMLQKEEYPSFFLYWLIPEDRNGDGKYKVQDGPALFYSLADGSGWRRLSPKDHRVDRVHVMVKEGKILMRAQKGPLGKGKVRFLHTSLKSPRKASRFFPAPFMKKVKDKLGSG